MSKVNILSNDNMACEVSFDWKLNAHYRYAFSFSYHKPLLKYNGFNIFKRALFAWFFHGMIYFYGTFYQMTTYAMWGVIRLEIECSLKICFLYIPITNRYGNITVLMFYIGHLFTWFNQGMSCLCTMHHANHSNVFV